MAAPITKSKEERLLLRVRLAQLLVDPRNLTLPMIAAELGISQQSVEHHKKVLLAEWRSRQAGLVDQYRAEMLSDLDRALAEAWDSWRQSRAGNRTVDQETGEVFEEENARPGDPAYMNLILGAWDRVARVVGLEAPKKLLVAASLSPQQIQEMSTDELKALREKLRGPSE